MACQLDGSKPLSEPMLGLNELIKPNAMELLVSYLSKYTKSYYNTLYIIRLLELWHPFITRFLAWYNMWL